LIDTIALDLIRSSLLYASEEMGIALRNSSYSPNIKERMDHSAALFDREGRLLAQAEHIPVHLGSLPWGLINTIGYCERQGIGLEKDSVLVTNNPYIAGTHLNDITVVKPIHSSGKLVAFAANKAHHSDVGGKVPGSISVDARTLYEEGLIVNPTYLIRHGEFVEETISLIVSNSRTPTERKGDLKAQVAATFTGNRRIQELVEKYGMARLDESSRRSFDYARKMIKSRISNMKCGAYKAEDYLEDPDGHDIRLKVRIEVSESNLEVDYSGTDAQVANPINAVFGVTLSGVHFVIRTLTGSDVPANHGAFSLLKVTAPSGTILNPTYPSPVAIGNVETSQRNADLLYRALSKAIPDRIPAASGGSMNNVMIGGMHEGSAWAFYETVGVGLGGRNMMDGIDGIQSNMTNTLNTPVEDIERSFPIIMRRYEFRVNSSGAGTYRGGNGIVRAYEMLGESTFTVVSERLRHKPWGLRGGGDGARARIILKKAKARGTKTVPGKVTLTLGRHDIVEIRTAGGGGYLPPKLRKLPMIFEDLKNGIITRSYGREYYPQAFVRTGRGHHRGGYAKRAPDA
jgi:N-methylhydantoinase B